MDSSRVAPTHGAVGARFIAPLGWANGMDSKMLRAGAMNGAPTDTKPNVGAQHAAP